MSDTSLFTLTGASRGLGTALAQVLIQPSHHLICAARGDNAESCAQTAAVGVTLDWHQVNLSDAHAAETWMTKTLAALPAFAKVTLVPNAGVVEPVGTVDTLHADTPLPHLQLNLADPMALTAALLRGAAPQNAQRCVPTISSDATCRPITGWVAYCAGKTGLDIFVRAINADSDASVHAVALAPGVIDTGMQHTAHGTDFAGVQRFRNLHAYGELVSPQDATTRTTAYLTRPDFGATELDGLHNVA